MKTPFPLLPVVLATSLFAYSGCRRTNEPALTETAVQVFTVANKTLPEEIVASGAIDAVDKAEVGFLVGGRVISVDAQDGAEVKKGQVLARLDSADYQQTLRCGCTTNDFPGCTNSAVSPRPISTRSRPDSTKPNHPQN